MILTLIALISVVVLSVWAASVGGYNLFTELFCPMLAGAAMIGLLFYAGLAWRYIGADHKARIINREYSTNYTQAEVFYASDVIETIREIDRKRFEVNGDLMTGE